MRASSTGTDLPGGNGGNFGNHFHFHPGYGYPGYGGGYYPPGYGYGSGYPYGYAAPGYGYGAPVYVNQAPYYPVTVPYGGGAAR